MEGSSASWDKKVLLFTDRRHLMLARYRPANGKVLKCSFLIICSHNMDWTDCSSSGCPPSRAFSAVGSSRSKNTQQIRSRPGNGTNERSAKPAVHNMTQKCGQSQSHLLTERSIRAGDTRTQQQHADETPKTRRIEDKWRTVGQLGRLGRGTDHTNPEKV